MAHSDRDEHIDMVEDCEKRESKLSEWEKGFIQSIGEQLRRGSSLTDRQVETLDKIWSKVT